VLSERAQRPGVGIAAQARTFIMLTLMPLLLVGFSPTPAVALRPALPFSLKHAAQRIRHTATRLAVDRQFVQAPSLVAATPSPKEATVARTNSVSKAATALGWGLSGASISVFSPIIFGLLDTGAATRLSVVKRAMPAAGFLGALAVPIRKRHALSSCFDVACLSAQSIALLVLFALLRGLALASVVALSALAIGAGFFARLNFAPMRALGAAQVSNELLCARPAFEAGISTLFWMDVAPRTLGLNVFDAVLKAPASGNGVCHAPVPGCSGEVLDDRLDVKGGLHRSPARRVANAVPTRARVTMAAVGTELSSYPAVLLNATFKPLPGVPLFEDIESYTRSLPVRRMDNDRFYRLVHFPYWAREDDLLRFVQRIEKKLVAEKRNSVFYVQAPSGRGKTACVLPAFLRSNFTHYLYLACDNNNGRHFRVMPDAPAASAQLAEKQGAAFALAAVKVLLGSPDDKNAYKIPLDPLPPSVKKTQAELASYLKQKLGDDCRCLFHLDEHRKMCDRDAPYAANFSRGAMATLASVAGARVVATYIDAPPLPARASSEVCRSPLALPFFDVWRALKGVPELRELVRRYDPQTYSREELRLFATLMFRLGFKLVQLGLNLLSLDESSEMQRFLSAFKAAAANEKHRSPADALKACLEVCQLRTVWPPDEIPSRKFDLNAARLLVGGSVAEDEQWSGRVGNLVLLEGGRIGGQLEYLLAVRPLADDPAEDVYLQGAKRVKRVLGIPGIDVVEGAPLETAYAWTLSCAAAVDGDLYFNDEVGFKFRCKALKPGRLFSGTSDSSFTRGRNALDGRPLETGVLYYAAERGEAGASASHPKCDLFFLTDDGEELVVIDVTGSASDKTVLRKMEALSKWVTEEQFELKQIERAGADRPRKVRGIVLAPFFDVEDFRPSNDAQLSVLLVRSAAARKLLGAVSQVALWLDSPQKIS